MSITFSFAETHPDGTTVHGVLCDHVCTRGPHGTQCDEALEWFGHCDHTEALRMACGCQSFDVNVSQDNAESVMERLGLVFDHCGSVDPDEMIGRCLIGNVGRDDTGHPSVESRGALGAQAIDMGLRAGYYEDTLNRLNDLAVEARRRGMKVGWC